MPEVSTIAGAVVAVIALGIIVWVLGRLKKKIPLTFADEMGASYIVKTKDSRKAYDMFFRIKGRGFENGMVISRVFPDRLRQKFGLENTAFMWLSHEQTKNSVDPSDLEKLEFLVQGFISTHKTAVVLLDGIEYIMLQNSFENTLKFLQSLNDRIILNKAVLIIPVDPGSLDKKEISLLEREMETYQVDYRLMRFFE